MAAALYRDGGFVADEWVTLDAETPLDTLAEAAACVLPLERLLAEAAAGTLPATGRLAALVTSGEDVARLAPVIGRLEMVAVNFPVFSDGRGYSTARLLRQRLRFAGEVRAVGDVLLDQIPLMRRVGFTAFAISHEPTRRALEAGRDVDVPLYLQPAERADEVPSGARAWARRPASART